MKRLRTLVQALAISTLFTNATVATPLSNFSQEKISNGMELVTLKSNKVPLVTIVLTVRAGAMTETPETDGLTHLWEHMFFKGNARLKDQEAFNKRIRQLGIVYNGDTSSEKVRYYFTLPSIYFEEGLQFMADAISSPKLDQGELEKERVVVLDEYDRNASNPGFELYRVTNKLIYGKNAYLRSALGTRKIIAKTTRKQLLDIKDEVFVPSNSALLIAGDIDHAVAKTLVEKHFKGWKDPKGWKPPKPNEFQKFPDRRKKSPIVMTHKQARNARTSIYFEGPKAKISPKDTYAADILISLLNQRTGKFYKEFIDSHLALGAGLSYHTQSQAGSLVLHGSSSSKNAKKLLARLETLPKDLLDENYFTKEQLEDVRRQLTISFKQDMNSPSDYIKTLAFWWAVTGLDYYKTYLDNLQKTDLKDVRNFVTKYMINKPYIKTALIPASEIKESGFSDNTNKLKKQYLTN